MAGRLKAQRLPPAAGHQIPGPTWLFFLRGAENYGPIRDFLPNLTDGF